MVTPERAAVHPLGPADEVRRLLDAVAADLDMAASDLAGPFAAAIRGSLDQRLARVGELLLGPVLPALGDRRLVLTPSGYLAGTPWSLLDGLAGRPLTIPTSATRWLALRRTPPATAAGSAWWPARTCRGARRRSPGPSREWPGARVLRGAEATAGRVSALAAEVDVLHLAGHGRHPGDNPLFSAVELVDGPWFGYDIDQLAATPSVVVLSACELGRVAVRSGEEAVGMSAAWLHAGARTVVSSPALVADDVACEVLAGWHQRVSRGEVRPTRSRRRPRPLGRGRRRTVAVPVLRHGLVTRASRPQHRARPGGSAPGERRVAPAGPSVWWQSRGRTAGPVWTGAGRDT